MTDRAHQRLWLAATLILTAVKIWLTRGQGVYAIGSAALDDRLFVELAQHLIRGEWLGPYSVLTLAKGPAYPMFIAASFVAGIPLFLAQHLFYAAACFAIVTALRPAIKSAGWRFAVYALLLVNPMTFDAPGMGRVLRQHIYGPLALLIFAGLIALYLRRKQSGRHLWPWSLLLGLGGGFFYLTREETVWLAPSVTLLMGACLIGAWRESRGVLHRMVAHLAFAFMVACMPVLTVCSLNKSHYGWFGTCEFRAPEFKDAYGAMTRVRIGPQVPFVPVTREARAAMAEISPAYAEVEHQFNQGLARTWAGFSSFFTGLPAENEQIGGGWYMWALREAVSNAGHTDDAATSLDFYQRLADEINSACNSGRIPAGPSRSGFSPVWQDGDTERLYETIPDFIDFVVRFRHFGATPPPSTGSAEELELFRDLTRERLQPPAGELDAVGAKRYLNNLWKVDLLNRTGQFLRFFLLTLIGVALATSTLGVIMAIWRRRWTYPLTIVASALGACFASILIHAAIQATSFPVKSVTSFSSVYPLLLVFVAAAGWDFCLLWRDRRALFQRSVTQPFALEPAPIAGSWRNRLIVPSLLGLIALLPFLIWQGEFRKLFWFGDGYFLLDQLAAMGFQEWTLKVFAENFVPVFKLLWGGGVLLFDGSYQAMLWLLWLTHALNSAVFARWLQRAGFSRTTSAISTGIFALAPTNLETLGWSVQWSAVLATNFMLIALWWFEKNRQLSARWSWKQVLPLVIFSTASACSFSRGVLTGGVLAACFLLPVLASRRWSALPIRMPAAMLCLAPAIGVALVIISAASGNHQHLEGHWIAVMQFAASYFFLNPFYAPLADGPVPTALLLLFGGIKLGVIIGGLRCTQGRIRHILWILLIYDLGNALLIGVGRYHTGFLAAMSSRYQYSSLLATMPFVALLLERAMHLITVPRLRRNTLIAACTFFILISIVGWRTELRVFTSWRGSELRTLMAAPATNDPDSRVTGLEYMHVERAKALKRAFNLH